MSMRYNRGSAKVVIFVIIILIIVAVVFFARRDGANVPNIGENVTNEISNSIIVSPVTHTVTYTDNGYTPKEITIKTGDTVVFHNTSSNEMWTATAIHPTHTVYPGSDIRKCGTSEADAIFDECRSVGSGGEWSFTFDKEGSWGYHNHLRPSDNGKITVK